MNQYKVTGMRYGRFGSRVIAAPNLPNATRKAQRQGVNVQSCVLVTNSAADRAAAIACTLNA